MDLGRSGEDLAAAYLVKLGYEILHRNWRKSHYEIDIVATKDGLLHFVEVKTRTLGHPILPEQNVNRKKIADLLKGAEAFLNAFRQYKDFRIDILSIRTRGSLPPEYFLIEDVYM